MKPILVLSYLILIICCSVVTHSLTNSSFASSQTSCLPDQSLALLQLKQEFAYNDHSCYASDYEGYYPKMKSWKAGKDCCTEWDGVICDMETGQVVMLNLNSSCLLGPLRSNSTLFGLRHLRQLNLAYNDFSDSQIPSTFGQLSRLTHLDLSYSGFSGAVPSEIGRLANLVSLNLSYSWFSGAVPSEIGRLANLVSLNLSYNDLSMTDLTQNMTHLKYLHLDGVNLSSPVLQSFGNLSSLQSLSLSHCSLSGEFPKTIFQLPELTYFDLSFNNFSGPIPSTLGDLSQLTAIKIIGNKFNGMIPPTLGNLSQLSELTLSGYFTGQIPHTFGNLLNLKTFALRIYLGTSSSTGGGFSGELPSSFGNLNQLEDLQLSGSKFDCQIPSLLGNLSRLTSLTLQNNGFFGKLPPWVTNLTQLTSLDISFNSLNGAIPSSLFTMPSLQYLVLYSNQFSGPLNIQNISSSRLVELDLRDNKLNGRIPRSISKLKNLEYLYLDSSNFSGTVDLDAFLKLSKLQYLWLSCNSFSVTYTSASNLTLTKFVSLHLSSCNISEFPDFLKTQDRLSELDLSNNKLEGKIPKWFFSIGIETLYYLYLSHNSITGWEQAPLVLPWKNLQVLDLRSNAFKGSLAVPPLSTRYFFISENNLSGSLHHLFCTLTRLVVLDISNNNLSGIIPRCLGGFNSSLLVLNLQGNNFRGKIPQMFSERSQLKTMDLSHNQLQGKVPPSLINCTALEVLNLGHNQITDTFPFWLQNLSELQVLVLHSNKFHGPIWQPQFFGFAKLRIVDLSFNNFTGTLPLQYFYNWSAMSNVAITNKGGLTYMIGVNGYYEDSVTVMNKGFEMVLVKILTIFTSIDLSNNNFSGIIPSSIGDLHSLIVLNLSGNSFEGHIPPSFGKLTELESLDLSNNRLSGRIPQELASLSFLQYLNLSHNQLTGLIPQAPHFDTFPNSSYDGNSDLCGFPLSKKCDVTTEAPNHDHSHEPESENGFGFGWKSVLIGYGCGFVVGVIGGYVLLSKKPNLLIRIYGRNNKW